MTTQTPASRLSSISRLVGKETLAQLPTPVQEYPVRVVSGQRRLIVKLDNLTGDPYGGNKVRKLEFILHRARQKNCERIATFGTVASHHALATAIYSRRLGWPCVCFLSHQPPSAATGQSLRMHLSLGTSLVRYGGAYRQRLRTLREHLWGRHPWVIPIGGSSWLGAVGFVAAGLELAEQSAAGLLPPPDRIYVAAGTMGTAAGLAVGLALADLPTEVHAVRVSDSSICNSPAMLRLVDKTVRMLHRMDRSVPRDLRRHTRVVIRDEFFAGGYARSNPETDAAIRFARDQLDLELESTYTGKAMAAVIRDLAGQDSAGKQFLFWNTFNSGKLVPVSRVDPDALPPEFQRYLS